MRGDGPCCRSRLPAVVEADLADPDVLTDAAVVGVVGDDVGDRHDLDQVLPGKGDVTRVGVVGVVDEATRVGDEGVGGRAGALDVGPAAGAVGHRGGGEQVDHGPGG